MSAHKFARTLDEAFPYGAEYGCAVTRYESIAGRWAGYALAILISVLLAAWLVKWWSS